MKYLIKISSFIMVLFVMMSSFSYLTFAKEKKIAIGSFEDFLKINDDLNADYYLTKDIDIKTAIKPFGDDKTIFSGTLDGRGHAIKNLKITPTLNSSKNSSFCALFVYNKGTVKNINFIDAQLNNSNANYGNTGIVCAKNIGTISNCYFSGNITSTNMKYAGYVGSAVGEMLSGKINNCTSYCNIISKGQLQYTGGFTGKLQNGIISDVMYSGTLLHNATDGSMDAYSGGVCGESLEKSSIFNALFNGGIVVEKSSNVYLGGISGHSQGKVSGVVVYGTVMPSEILSHTYIGAVGEENINIASNVYYFKNFTSAELTTKNGTALSRADLKDEGKYKTLDFNNVWQMGKNGPELKNIPFVPKGDDISSLIGVRIVSLPKKLKYTQGDQTLDITGLKVNAVYSGGEVTLKNNEFSIGGYNYVKVGKQTITVAYKGFYDSFKIKMVAPKEPTVISIENFVGGSYTDGTVNGTPKEGSLAGGTSKDNDTANNKSNNGKKPAKGVAPNIVEDTLEDDEGNPTVNDTATNPNSYVPSQKSNIAVIITIAVGFVLIIAVAVLRIILEKKKK